MINKNTPIKQIFDTRITRILNSVFITKLGDFENSSIEILENCVAGAGDKTIEIIRKVIEENNIQTLDVKIQKLVDKKEKIKEYIRYKRKVRDIEHQIKMFKSDISYLKVLEKELQDMKVLVSTN